MAYCVFLLYLYVMRVLTAKLKNKIRDFRFIFSLELGIFVRLHGLPLRRLPFTVDKEFSCHRVISREINHNFLGLYKLTKIVSVDQLIFHDTL